MTPITQFGKGQGNDLLIGRRRQTPSEQTRKEFEYIDWLSKNRIPVVIKLVDNEEVRGWIEYYDRDIIRLTRNGEANLFIYKERVKYLYEAAADAGARRTTGKPVPNAGSKSF